MLGGHAPAHVDELVDLGLLARPDLVRLQGWVRDRRRVDRRAGVDAETAHSLTDRVRVHRSDRAPATVEVSLVFHRRPVLAAEAVTISLRPLDDEGLGTERDAALPRELWTLHDASMRVLATDPRLADLGIEPGSQVGMLAASLVHPEDLPDVLDPVTDVLAGRTRSAHVRVRAAAADGSWQPGTIELRRLVGDGGPLILGIFTLDQPGRRPIPPGLLSPRQRVVVGALFDGRRVKDIAAVEHVSVRTVRNQLAAAYRKLDVAGQAELLSTYLRPHDT